MQNHRFSAFFASFTCKTTVKQLKITLIDHFHYYNAQSSRLNENWKIIFDIMDLNISMYKPMGLSTGGAYTRVQNCSFCNVGLYTGGAYTWLNTVSYFIEISKKNSK